MIMRAELRDYARLLAAVRAVPTAHHGLLALAPGHELFHRIRDALHLRAAAEDADEYDLHLRVGGEHREGGRITARRRRPRTHVEETRRTAALLRDHVHRGHRHAGTAGNEPDIPVEPHVHVPHVEAVAQHLADAAFIRLAQRVDLLVAEMRPLVTHDFRVRRAERAAGQLRQRIDLDRGAVVHRGDAYQALGERDDFLAPLVIRLG